MSLRVVVVLRGVDEAALRALESRASRGVTRTRIVGDALTLAARGEPAAAGSSDVVLEPDVSPELEQAFVALEAHEPGTDRVTLAFDAVLERAMGLALLQGPAEEDARAGSEAPLAGSMGAGASGVDQGGLRGSLRFEALQRLAVLLGRVGAYGVDQGGVLAGG
jgi:hypothetical protein